MKPNKCTCTEDPRDFACDVSSESTSELEANIKYHDHKYWVENDPEITDAEYDKLVNRLPDDHYLKNEINSTATSREKVKHTTPMLSLRKVQSVPELMSWARSVARSKDEVFVWSSKKDGLSGEFDGTRLVTRGDGEYGFDITDRLTYLTSPPEPGRGEILVTKETFKVKKPAREDGSTYKTERSAASGLVNNTKPIPHGILEFVPFHLDAEEFTLEELGYVDFDELIKSVKTSPYPTDGAVLALKDREYADSLGVTSHHPIGSVALKFGNESATTKLIGVEWTPGKRKLTPTAILEPVEIEGFTNSRASLHNVDQVRTLGLKIGDTVELERCNSIIPQVELERCNSIIPQVVRVVKKAKNGKVIDCELCPACGGETTFYFPDLVCTNIDCGGTKAKLLHDAITRLGIENIGPATVSSMVAYGFNTIVKVLDMKAHDFAKLPGFAKKSAESAAGELLKLQSSEVEDYRILAALNIPGIGLTVSKRLLSNNTLVELRDMSIGELEFLSGIGRVHATNIYESLLSNFTLIRLLQRLDVRETNGLEARPIVVFTGKSDVKRDEWIKRAEAKGFAFAKAVTKKTTLIVTNDAESNSSKDKKARKYGIEIITYDDFDSK